MIMISGSGSEDLDTSSRERKIPGSGSTILDEEPLSFFFDAEVADALLVPFFTVGTYNM